MNRRALLEKSLWGAVLLVGLWSGLTWDRRPEVAHATAPEATVPLLAAQGAPVQALPDTSSIAVERNPFRLDRRPAAVPFGATSQDEDGIEYHPEPEEEQSAPVLRGILGGPPWEALLEGVGGREGSVLVRAGDVIGTLRVRSVGRDTVVVQDAETTWRLTLGDPWP